VSDLFFVPTCAAPCARAASGPRRPYLALILGLALLLWLPLAPAAPGFGLDTVTERARSLASQAYQAPVSALPEELRQLSYDQYRDIRFKPQNALWHAQALPFEAMFFHLGKFQTQAVQINEISEDGVHHLSFDRQDFDYGHNSLHPGSWGDLGYAGFRIHAALNSAGYKDELVVFLGASYFRALGQGQRYGLSARGLAVDTVEGQGEEFPRFVEFWLERPGPQATALVLYALMDSPRLTGAYRFTIQPGVQTLVQVQGRVFLRAGVANPIARLGLAPLTSMFDHGENQPRSSDFRPEVHDSDGLMMALGDASGGTEWLWRPLINPAQTLVTSFATPALKGFGLMQRDRNPTSYEDTEAQYERRPSIWVEPQSPWGPGRVELVQLHTPDETNDNIVAYWVPDQLPAPGEALAFDYALHFQGDEQQRPPTGWTLQSRRGHGYVDPQEARDPREVQYVIDFDGPALRALPPEATPVAIVSAGAGARIAERNVYRHPGTGAWRLTLRVDQIPPAQPVELRAFLQQGSNALTETWTTILPKE